MRKESVCMLFLLFRVSRVYQPCSSSPGLISALQDVEKKLLARPLAELVSELQSLDYTICDVECNSQRPAERLFDRAM